SPTSVQLEVMISMDAMSADVLARGLTKIHSVLRAVEYRIVGAGALWAMGHTTRQTADFDVLLPGDAEQISARTYILSNASFGQTAVGSLYVKVGGQARNIDLVTPDRIKLSGFPDNIYIQHQTLARIAPLECLLEAKISAVRDPARKPRKRESDTDDIVFVLRLAASKDAALGLETVPGLDK
ncbi:hypothetical protein BDV96DRAFT_478531, partial [Lophiotrema nucula]